MKGRLAKSIRRLQAFYGVLAAPPTDAFALFVWEILSNHSTPKKRDAAFDSLKRQRLLTPEAMWRAAAQVLEEAVGRAGPYRDQRLLTLRKGVEVFQQTPTLCELLKGPLSSAMFLVKQLPRMSGDSGAYRMLLFAGGHALLPVDARVGRVATRLGYGENHSNFGKTAKTIRQAVAHELTSSDSYRRTYIYLAHHGAMMCTEAHPRCDECPLVKECPYGSTWQPPANERSARRDR